MSKQSKKIVRFYSLALVIGVITFLLSASIGLGGQGFSSEHVLSQFTFYLSGGIYLLLLIIGFSIELHITKNDEKYGDSIGFSSLGETPHLKIFKRFTQPQSAFLAAIIFGFLGLLSAGFKMETFTGIAQLEQQFTPTVQMLFSTTLIPGSENLGLALVIASCLIVLRIIGRKTNMSSANFKLFALFFIPFIGALYWVINHLLRYADQAISLMKVGLFGFVQSLMTVITGNFIFAWILHISNNLFFDLRKFLNLESIFAFAGVILIVMVILYIIIYRGRLFGRKVED